MRKTAAIAGLLLMAAVPLPAAANSVTLKCNLKQIIREVGSGEAETLRLELVIDVGRGTAKVVSEEETGEVKIARGDEATTFVQLFPSGEIRTTTISDFGRAAHSRHTVVRGEVVPTLYHGDCR